MSAAQQADHGCCSSERTTPRLEDLIPIAVVIAAGCERCAGRMVERALREGSPRVLIRRTLGLVAHLRLRDCFVKAVGPEVIDRMEKALEAGRKTFRKSDPRGRTSHERNCIDRGAPSVRESNGNLYGKSARE